MNIYLEEFNPLMLESITHALPFAFDKRFSFTSDRESVDAVPILYTYNIKDQENQFRYFENRFSTKTLALIFYVFNDCEDDDRDRLSIYQQYYENVILFSTSYNAPARQNYFYDLLWNRTKGAYGLGFVNKDLLKNSIFIKGFDLDIFQLSSEKNIEYNILCPNRRYLSSDLPIKNRLYFRNLLHDFLIGKSMTIMSDPDSGNILQTAQWKPQYQNQLIGGGKYAPLDPKYYNLSLVSCYIESVAVNKMHDGEVQVNKTITEKTWEPLLKGHFILPFASSGIVKELSKRTFRFPDFIDYSYTEIEDDNKRFAEFLSLTESIRKMPISESKKVYERNIDVIKHNIDLFKKLPYDCLYSKIEQHSSI